MAAEVQKVAPMANADYARKRFEVDLSEFPFGKENVWRD